ncbi:uncharacterized protein SCHCODRAFT_02543489 [Schizophyllum commune H4-8]|nr:uncharacterized protein SCHCODRAFT_02543489 [Schizophyllum commune H4-8]KAI5890894.1 hypothetical protein SCHCODRAFT_02543489 [Schizophyllum commune H4-8]
MSSTSPSLLAPASVELVQWTAITVGVQMTLYGVHTALFFISLSVLFHHSPNNLALRAATTSIFICASVAFVGTVPFYLIQLSFFKGPPSASALRTADDIMVSNIVAQRVMLFIADLVAAWRAWVVWMRDTRVAWVLAACMLGVVVCSAGEVTLYIQSKVSGNDNFGKPVRIIFSIVPGLVANLVCTVLVGWRTWSYRRLKARSVASGRSSPNRIERVLVLLAESGAIYVAFFVLLLAMYMKNYLSGKDYAVGLETVVQVAFGELVVCLPSLPYTASTTANQADDAFPHSLPYTFVSIPTDPSLLSLITLTQAVIPTLVIIAVALQRSQADPFVSTGASGGVVLSRSIQFRSGPSSRPHSGLSSRRGPGEEAEQWVAEGELEAHRMNVRRTSRGDSLLGEDDTLPEYLDEDGSWPSREETLSPKDGEWASHEDPWLPAHDTMRHPTLDTTLSGGDEPWPSPLDPDDPRTSPACEDFVETFGHAESTAVATEESYGILLRPMGASRGLRPSRGSDEDALPTRDARL